MLDMMEYKAAIINYLKALSENPMRRDARKNIGYAYFQLDKIDDALKFLKEELKLFPDNEDAYDLLVYILYKLNKLEEADRFLEDYHFSVKLSEENPHLGGLGCFILGMHFKGIKEYDRARTFFRADLEKGYNPVQSYIQLIDIDLTHGNLKTAPEFSMFRIPSVLAEAYRQYGPQPEFQFMNGLRCFEKSKSDVIFLMRSIYFFKQAVKLKPDFKDSLYNLACIAYNINDFGRASEYFREFLEIEPENADVKAYLNCCLEKLGKSAVSIPGQCPAWINLSREFIDKPDMEYKYNFKNDVSFVLNSINSLALEFIEQGRFHEAIKRYYNGLKIDPENPGFHYNLGIVYTWLDNPEEAERNYLDALRRRDFFGTLPGYRRQEILREKNRSRQKEAPLPLSEWTFEAAWEEGNYFIDAYNNLGSLYWMMKDFEKSILVLRKAIDIYPEDAMGHYNLGCTYQSLGEGKNAEKEWKEAIKCEKEAGKREERAKISDDQLTVSLLVFKRPVSFRAHKGLGWLYLEENLPAKALKEFEKAIELEPSDPEPYYELGKIYQDKSVQDEKYVRKAIFYYEKYLYLGGEKEKEVKELLKLLK